MRYLLKNAKFFSQGVFHLADVFLSDGKIVSIGDGVSPSDDTIVIDISNMVLFPGFVDVHVHLREPGFFYKETIRSGTLAAAHGGFAHVAEPEPRARLRRIACAPARAHREGRPRSCPSLRGDHGR